MSVLNHDKTVALKLINFLLEKGLTKQGISAVLANADTESGLYLNNLQNSFEGKAPYYWTNETYTAAVDDCTYTLEQFKSDKAGYGLCQWTSSGRKENLWNWAKGYATSIASEECQFNCLWSELNSSYRKTVLKYLISDAYDIDTCTRKFMINFEAPKNQSEENQLKRVNKAKEFYDLYFGENIKMRELIVNTALSFVKTTYDSNNDIIFITDYYGKKIHRKEKYCCMFTWDIMRMVGDSLNFYGGRKTARCTTHMQWWIKNHPTWVHTKVSRCKPGDYIFYQFDSDPQSEHTGFFLEKVNDSGYFYAVEGNTSNSALGSQSNGGWVMKKKRHVKKVLYFVSIPREEDEKNPYPEPTRTLQKDCEKGEDVKWLQWYLNNKGYPCEIDGSFGKKTDKVFRQWQTEYYPEIFHLKVDGKCGGASRNAFKHE